MVTVLPGTAATLAEILPASIVHHSLDLLPIEYQILCLHNYGSLWITNKDLVLPQ